MSRAPALVAILVASVASAATSSPETSGSNEPPQPSDRWSATTSPERVEHELSLGAGAEAGFRVRVRFEGDLQVLAEEHRARLFIRGRAVADGDDVPTLTLEARDDEGVIEAETQRAQDTPFRLNAPFSTDHCPRQSGASCEGEIDVWVRLGDVAAHVEWSVELLAFGDLEEPAITEVYAEFETEPL